MEPGVGTPAAQLRSGGLRGGRAVTRALLRLGVVAGPFYLAVGLLQAVLRPGFDVLRHPLSVLSNGPAGWIQTLNFVITGLLVLAAAWGIFRALGRPARLVAWSVGIYGAGMLLAAAFRADPVDGFPPGTPAGVPETVSTVGLLHFMAGGVGFIALAVACFAAAALMSRRHRPAIARMSLVCGLVVVVGFLGGMAVPAGGTLGIWLSVIAGWLWLALLCRHLYVRAGGSEGV